MWKFMRLGKYPKCESSLETLSVDGQYDFE